jgi:hypothetical protein
MEEIKERERDRQRDRQIPTERDREREGKEGGRERKRREGGRERGRKEEGGRERGGKEVETEGGERDRERQRERERERERLKRGHLLGVSGTVPRVLTSPGASPASLCTGPALLTRLTAVMDMKMSGKWTGLAPCCSHVYPLSPWSMPRARSACIHLNERQGLI